MSVYTTVFLAFTPVSFASGTAVITVTVTDDLGATVTEQFTVTVNTVNDPPVNSVPGAQAVNEDNNLSFSTSGGNAISVSDLDAGTSNLQVALSTTDAVLTLAGTAGLTFQAGGNGSAAMTFAGTATRINAALDGLVFAPDLHFNGSSSVLIVTDDDPLK